MSKEPLHLRGVVLPGGETRDVFVADGTVTFNPVAGARTLATEGYLLPGLVDAHAHLGIASPAPAGASAEDQVRASARQQLDAGVLVVREPGGPSYHSRDLGPHLGLPRIFTGGRFLAPPGRYFPGLSREVPADRLAEAAVEEVRASGFWAKVIGDFFGPDGEMIPNFSRQQLTAAAEAVHAAGGRITIHATVPESIEMAIEAGFDAIEHGTSATLDHADAMGRRGMAFIPTTLISGGIIDLVRGQGAAPASVKRWQDAIARQPEVIRRATEQGAVVLAGTDAGMVSHGLVAHEIANLRSAGLGPDDALAAGSWGARRYLGLPGIEEGAPADITVYAADPRADVAALQRPLVRILDGVEVRR